MFKDKFLICLIVLVVAVSVASSLLSFPGFSDIIPDYIGQSDIRLFADRATNTSEPYINSNKEYPAITSLFIYSMGLFGKELYYILTSVFLTLFAVITSVLLYKIVEDMGLNKKRLLYLWALTPTFLFFVIYNWDILAVMFTVASFYFIQKGKPIPASVFLALGFSSKLFPIVFIIPFLLKNRFKSNMKFLSMFAAAFLLANSYFLITNLDGWVYTYTFHSGRVANIDSVWGIVQRFYPGVESGLINMISLIMFSASYAILLAKYRKRSFWELSFLSILLFLLFNKVFSPQYIFWILIFFIVINVDRRLFHSLEAVNITVLVTILAWYMGSITGLEITFMGVLIRHIIIIYIVYWLIRRKPHVSDVS